MEQEKGKSTGLLIATILFGASTVALGIALAAKIMNSDTGSLGIENKNTEKCIVTQAEIETPEVGSVAEVVANYSNDDVIRKLIRKVANKVIIEADYGHGAINYQYDTGRVAYDAGNNFVVSPEKTYGFKAIVDGGVAAGSKATDYAFSYAEDVLKEEGVSNEDAIYTNKNADIGYATYYGNNIRCTMRTNRYDNIVEFSCAHDDWMSQGRLNEAKKISNALNGNVVGRFLDFNTDIDAADKGKIETSKNGEYEYINVGVSNDVSAAYSMLYRKVGESEWTFFMETQNTLSCGLFTGELTKVYEGYSCYDELGSSALRTVKAE